jgi:hypothetical protein
MKLTLWLPALEGKKNIRVSERQFREDPKARDMATEE